MATEKSSLLTTPVEAPATFQSSKSLCVHALDHSITSPPPPSTCASHQLAAHVSPLIMISSSFLRCSTHSLLHPQPRCVFHRRRHPRSTHLSHSDACPSRVLPSSKVSNPSPSTPTPSTHTIDLFHPSHTHTYSECLQSDMTSPWRSTPSTATSRLTSTALRDGSPTVWWASSAASQPSSSKSASPSSSEPGGT